LQISNSAELPEYLDAQIRALEHLARTPGFALHVPEVVRCSDGGAVVRAGRHRVWLVTWLDGVPIARLASRPPELLRALGRALGDLDRRLAGFDDPAVHREFRWDLMQAPAILPLTESIGDPAGRDLVRRRLRRFETEVIPRLERLPFQVVHNDANDGNVLVCRERLLEGGREVGEAGETGNAGYEPCGLLDFGDMMWTPRVSEPAIAIAYAMLGPDAPLDSARALLTGYQESLPLDRDEIEVLPDLIEARLCVSVTISAYERKRDPENAFVTLSEGPAWRILDWLADDPGARLSGAFANACGDSSQKESDQS
jgi:Ser/Thr protein kinase RdoA (MazF antagonist)